MLGCTSVAHTNRHVYIRERELPNICSPCGCLMDIYMAAPPDTVQSNRAHQETSDSLYHRCFYFTLIQNKHTWRSTNRCTQAHTQSTSDPEPTQNSSRHFSRLSEREGALPPARNSRQNGYKAEWSESNSNRTNLILQPHVKHTRTHLHKYSIS